MERGQLRKGGRVCVLFQRFRARSSGLHGFFLTVDRTAFFSVCVVVRIFSFFFHQRLRVKRRHWAGAAVFTHVVVCGSNTGLHQCSQFTQRTHASRPWCYCCHGRAAPP